MSPLDALTKSRYNCEPRGRVHDDNPASRDLIVSEMALARYWAILLPNTLCHDRTGMVAPTKQAVVRQPPLEGRGEGRIERHPSV
jgi:hypothetical protein